MQDDRSRAEADRRPLLLETPADVDVVAGDPELRIEAPHRLQRLAPEGHVAPGDVLGDFVGEQDVGRPARSARDGALDEARILRDEVGPADAGVVGGRGRHAPR